MKSKLKSYTIIFVLICATTLQASQIQNSTVQKYLDELLLIQNQVFTLAQRVVCPLEDITTAQHANMLHLENSLDSINKKLTEALTTITENNETSRELRLLLTAVNYIQNSLYELRDYCSKQNAPEKLLILERFFNFRP